MTKSVTNIASLATARSPRAARRPKPLPRRCKRATRAASRSRLRASSIRPPKYRLTGVRMPTARPPRVDVVRGPAVIPKDPPTPAGNGEHCSGQVARVRPDQNLCGVRVEQPLGVRRGSDGRARIVVVDEPDGSSRPSPCTRRPSPAFTASTQARRAASTCRPCRAFLPDTETLSPNLMATANARSGRWQPEEDHIRYAALTVNAGRRRPSCLVLPAATEREARRVKSRYPRAQSARGARSLHLPPPTRRSQEA